MRPVHITDTTLRDAHQSLWATRMEIGDMLPLLPKIGPVGFWSPGGWGGAIPVVVAGGVDAGRAGDEHAQALVDGDVGHDGSRVVLGGVVDA